MPDEPFFDEDDCPERYCCPVLLRELDVVRRKTNILCFQLDRGVGKPPYPSLA